MKSLEQQIKNVLLDGMYIPEALSKLFSWIESNGFVQTEDGCSYGHLYDLNKLRNEWNDNERHGGTIIEFMPEGNKYLNSYFGENSAQFASRVSVFAKTGADGSMAAFWIDDNGDQKIVHLGSGSGSTLDCVLADDPVDFIRLLAIGYDEICWNNHFDSTAQEASIAEEMIIHPNIAFQNWVKSTFNVTIPKRACEIVKHPSEDGDENSKDTFFNWMESIQAY